MWQQRLGTSSEFCRAVVSNGYLTEKQMQRAMERYRLGASRDGGVIFWQIDECDQLRDGKIMHYCPDCHRDHDRKPTWAAYLLRKHGQLPKEWNTDHCLFGLHLLKTLPLPLPIWRGAITSASDESSAKTICLPPWGQGWVCYFHRRGGSGEDCGDYVGGKARVYLASHRRQDGTERGEASPPCRPPHHPLPRY